MYPTILKNIPAPVNSLIRPFLFVSLGLHGLLLVTPLPGNETKPAQEKQVKVTQLSPTAKQSGSTKKVQAKPKSAAKNRAPLRRAFQPVVRPPAANPIPSLEQPQRQAQSDSPALGENQPQPERQTGDANVSQSPFADFPHYPGAKPGCLELQSCFQTNTGLAAVAAHFQKVLPGKKYTVDVDSSEANRTVFLVTKGGTTQYLSVLVPADGKAIYVLAPEPRTLKDLQDAVEVPGEFYTLLAGLGSETADPASFAAPGQFYTSYDQVTPEGSVLAPEARPETDGSFRLISDQAPAEVYNTYFAPDAQDYFKVTPVGNYGGGKVYKLQKDKFAGYLNLVPTKDNQGTIVVMWTSSPI